MNAKDNRILRRRKRNLQKRLGRRRREDQAHPVLAAQNIHYEMSDRARAIECGGIGAFHTLARNVGLIDGIDENLDLLKVHVPYHESDHVLNIA